MSGFGFVFWGLFLGIYLNKFIVYIYECIFVDIINNFVNI